LRFRPGAARYQTGGINWITMTGLRSSLELITSLPTADIASHTVELTDRLLDGVEAKGYHVVSSRKPEHRSAIVAFSTGNRDDDEAIVTQLEAKKISVALRGLGIRVSPYFYNTHEEIDQLLEALPSQA
jgi:cysteine desulfurase / selenocysteine lyase